ncbi:uncharacterized protein LDX57_012502 [Aspergillus melleus]|uniref:uncharacterized protein n=1 Tax=Aspergillus melleus TaxID=138277 RepID=UPI001E8E04D3|nr:uncharacterized protein LDX57_012502 [Aspergillus melleus]KAH8434871.1 hypothetical protein LDX57_012502 [Aspergillus melleus]
MTTKTDGYFHDDAYDTGKLRVSTIHTLHYEQYGNPSGKPVLFLHGGPGGSTSKSNTKFFNPSRYRVVLFDQRGCGRSTPLAELRENTSQHLIGDIETLRKHLSIPKWDLVFGGSWGSALALLYAQAFPKMVTSMILRGVFTARRSELEFSRGKSGAARIFPEEYDRFVSFIPENDREEKGVIAAYYDLLIEDDREKQLAAAREWNRWDLSIGALLRSPNTFEKLDDDDWVLSHARLEAHYFVNAAEEGQILREENLERIRHIRTTIVQGRYDVVCAPQTAWELHKGLPDSRLFWVADAGHAATEPATQAKLIEVCDSY